MAFDAHKNFAYSLVSVAPSPAASGTSLTVRSGEGAFFPAAPFNATVSPAGVLPLSNNAEIVRVTALAGDVMTLTRVQEGTTARSIAVGDQIFAAVTAKALTDVETQAALLAQANTFTANQLISSANPAVILDDTSQAANARKFVVTNGGGLLRVDAESDAYAVQATPIQMYRTGDVVFPSGAVKVGSGVASIGAGDLGISRNSAPTTGVVYFGNTNGFYLYYNGANFILQGAPLNVGLNSFKEKEVTATLSGGTLTCDCTQGNNFYAILNQNVTTISFSGLTVGSGYNAVVTLFLRQDGTGGRTVASSGFYFPSGWTMPAAASAWAILSCYYSNLIGAWTVCVSFNG